MKREQKNRTRIPGIILKDLCQEITTEEMLILQEWLSETEDNRLLYEKLQQKEYLVSSLKEYNSIDSRGAWEKALRKIEGKTERNTRYIIFSVLKYAAILAIPVLIASYFLFQQLANTGANISFAELEEQIAGLEQSSLIMADGEIINLQTVSKTSIVAIDGTQIAKKDSTLLYNKELIKDKEATHYNSLVTPKSKVFSVVLADGTKVWLNASSAIKYPTQFGEDMRQVFLTGEAYFEVSKDSSRPFIVTTSNMEVEVLGTWFNVMAYPEEKVVETTLVRGKVKVKTSNRNLTLSPGMQAQLNKETKSLDHTQINTDLTTSWRFGKYIFEYENLETVMTKLSRWYNIDISFGNTKTKNLHFSGTLHKYNDINETLHIIELATNVKFESFGNKILVN